ncbi:hypothetical protein [Endozoicomonas sp. ISHI1]|uniref:hypothetical protein n=1 Tax=Endozoicomonas sp. ISHI1 TaxID=2825882 RepID=UPI002147684B|nr:hypothetical protein [Endozoicomonas sp. ISHI1]
MIKPARNKGCYLEDFACQTGRSVGIVQRALKCRGLPIKRKSGVHAGKLEGYKPLVMHFWQITSGMPRSSSLNSKSKDTPATLPFYGTTSKHVLICMGISAFLNWCICYYFYLQCSVT